MSTGSDWIGWYFSRPDERLGYGEPARGFVGQYCSYACPTCQSGGEIAPGAPCPDCDGRGVVCREVAMNNIATVVGDTLHIAAGDWRCAIAVKDIEANWSALSHFPARRAQCELAALANRLNTFAAHAADIASRGGALDIAAECERFARRHVSLTRRAWALESRCLSWFVTGRANFPVRANEKRMMSRDKAYAAVYAHAAAARDALKRIAWPHGAPGDPIRADNPDAPALIRAKIDAARTKHALMKAANEAIRAAKTDDEAALIEAVHGVTGWAHDTCAKVVARDPMGNRGFPSWALANNLAEIKRLEKRLKTIEANRSAGMIERTYDTRAGAVWVVEDPNAARVQIIFHAKPDEATRAILKQHGFRWAPSAGAWQRHLTNAGRYAATQVLDKIGAAESPLASG